MNGAAARWRLLASERSDAVRRVEARAGTGPRANAERAERFAAQVLGSGAGDPFLGQVRAAGCEDRSVLDVGCGPGRLALPLAGVAREVVGVDADAAMLGILRREADRAGLRNVRTVQCRWEDAVVGPADVTICAYVLHSVVDPVPFLTKLHAHPSGRVLLCTAAADPDLALEPLWRHFHGARLPPGPSYLDALAVLDELGIVADASIVVVPSLLRFGDLEAAVDFYLDLLVLPRDDPHRRRVAALLGTYLFRRDGMLAHPTEAGPTAVISWTPGR